MVLVPWDFGREMSGYRGFMRGNSLPVTLIEILIFFLAMARGFSPLGAVSALPEITKAGLALFLLTAMWTTFFVATSSIIAILGLIKIIAHFMFGLVMVDQLARWSFDQRQYIWLTIGWGVMGYCLLWVINIVCYDPVGEDWIWLVPTLTNIRWIGFFALASFCAGISLIQTMPDGRIGRAQLFIALIFGTVGLTIAFWTGTRGAVVAILSASILLSLVFADGRKIALFAVSSAALALVISAALPEVHPSYGVGRIIAASAPTNGVVGISAGRIPIWLDTVDKISLRPFLGWGIDQFRFSFPQAQTGVRHPHQAILQLLYSNGLIGMLAALMIVVPFIGQVVRKFSQPYQFAALAYLFGALTYGLYDGFFYYTYSIMIMLVAAACVIAPTTTPRANDMLD